MQERITKRYAEQVEASLRREQARKVHQEADRVREAEREARFRDAARDKAQGQRVRTPAPAVASVTPQLHRPPTHVQLVGHPRTNASGGAASATDASMRWPAPLPPAPDWRRPQPLTAPTIPPRVVPPPPPPRVVPPPPPPVIPQLPPARVVATAPSPAAVSGPQPPHHAEAAAAAAPAQPPWDASLEYAAEGGEDPDSWDHLPDSIPEPMPVYRAPTKGEKKKKRNARRAEMAAYLATLPPAPPAAPPPSAAERAQVRLLSSA